LTNTQETDITTFIQRRRQQPPTLVAIDRNSWSRSVGMSGRDRRNAQAETTGRVCYAMELSPAYVDVAVERWQRFTGQQAMLAGDGRGFDALKAERLTKSDSEAPPSVNPAALNRSSFSQRGRRARASRPSPK
jgi:hypothetical protein